MGTTADKLQAVLNSKNAIRDKFNLPADMPFSEYAENIKGGSMDFFKCAAVAGEEKEPIPEPVFAEKFNGTLTNDFTQLGEAPEYSTIDGRQGLKCDYDHRLSHSAEALPAGNSPRTMSAWVYCNEDSLSGEWSFICGYGWTDPETFYIAVFWGDLLCYHAADHPYDLWSAFGGNAWKHVVFSFDGEKVTGYMDGVKIGETVCTFDTNVKDQPLCIGWISTDDRPFSTDAYISDLQIYDTALTAEQVKELYEGIEDTPFLPANTWNGYKAVLVEETVTTEGETMLIVSGSGIADGNYKPMDSTATGNSRIWKHTDSEWYFVWTGSSWVINTSPTYSMGQEKFYPDTTGDENPWDVTTWWGDDGNVNMTITQQTTEGTSETKKYYTFEETLTEGLTFGNGFTPVVDKVYDAEAMIKATLSEKFPILSTPDNLTGYENDEWKVFADNEFAEHIAWHAFDGNPDSIWADSGSGYLTWQNKLRQVLVRQLEFIYDGNAHSNYVVSFTLQGSDDGSAWTDIGSAVIDGEYVTDGNYQKATVPFPNNETSYFYHRIYAIGEGRNLIGSLIGKRIIE